MTQCARILARLKAFGQMDYDRESWIGDWVPLPHLQNPNGQGQIMQYNTRIRELRRGEHDGTLHDIENKTKTVNGVRHSWYRIVE